MACSLFPYFFLFHRFSRYTYNYLVSMRCIRYTVHRIFRPRTQARRACRPCRSRANIARWGVPGIESKLANWQRALQLRSRRAESPEEDLAMFQLSSEFIVQDRAFSILPVILSFPTVAYKAFADLPIADRSRSWSVERILGETRVPPRVFKRSYTLCTLYLAYIYNILYII